MVRSNFSACLICPVSGRSAGEGSADRVEGCLELTNLISPWLIERLARFAWLGIKPHIVSVEHPDSIGENVSAIESLTSRVQWLNNSVDWWNTAIIVALVFAAVAAVMVGGTTYLAFKKAKQLANAVSELSAAKEAKLSDELRNQGERTAKAEQRAAEAEQKAEGFRLDIATANQRAAEAARTAESERLERVKIEEKLKPRTLSGEQQQRMEEKLKPFSGTPYELAVDPIPEAINLIGAVDAILRSSGWVTGQSAKTNFRMAFTLPSGSKVEQEYSAGVAVKLTRTLSAKYGTAAEAFILALQAEGIPARYEILPESDPSPHNIHVTIGSKE
jgi:hypothetical protein